MGRKKKPIDYIDVLKRMGDAGLKMYRSNDDNETSAYDEIPSLDKRIEVVLGLLDQPVKIDSMLFFVMYDIEDNKVRRYIAKYLEKCGCFRIQKSIYLANLPHSKYNEIRDNLVAVQEIYDNTDSILVVPISTEYLKSMKIIGHNIDVDLIVKNKNTIFF